MIPSRLQWMSLFDAGPLAMAEPVIVTWVIIGIVVGFAVEVALWSGARGLVFARLLQLCRFGGAR
jgi:hypothetical protein